MRDDKGTWLSEPSSVEPWSVCLVLTDDYIRRKCDTIYVIQILVYTINKLGIFDKVCHVCGLVFAYVLFGPFCNGS